MNYANILETIAGILTKNMPEETVLITPSSGEGRRLLHLLAVQGYFIAGVRTETPRSLAREICAACMDTPQTILEREEARDVMFGMLNAMPEEGFFKGEHAKDRKTNELMFDAVTELETNAVRPVGGNDRLDALERIRKAYIEARGRELLDGVDLLRFAAEHAEQHYRKAVPYFVTLSTYKFNAAEEKLIHAIGGDRLTIIPMPVPEEIEVPGNRIGASGEPVSVDDSAIRFVRCRGMETEVRFIMRDILNRQLRAEDCAVIFMSGEYRSLLNTEANLFHVPITISGGVPLSGSELYFTLSQLAVWRLSEYDAEKLRNMILNGGVSVPNRREFLYRLRRKNIGWGAVRYLDRLLKIETDEDIEPQIMDEWRAFIECILAVADQNGSIDAQKTQIRRFLNAYIAVRGREDGAALSKAKRMLESIHYLGDDETVLSRLLEMMENAAYLSMEEEPGKVFALPLSESFLTGRKVLYFCGMSRFSMQGSTQESPIMLDEEKEKYGLPTIRDREAENVFRFYMTLLAHEGEIILSYCDYDTEKMTDLTPSPVYNTLKGERDAEIISYIPEEPILIGDFAAREEFAGVIGAPAGVPEEDEQPAKLEPGMSYSEQIDHKVFSPSALEDALACPLRFYLKRILHLEPVEIPERSNDRWLEAHEMGSLCHGVLEIYFGRDNTCSLKEIFEAEIAKLREERPDAIAAAMKKDTERAWAMVERAVKWTEAGQRTVLATEQKFGFTGSDQPMDIRIGDRTIRLCGSIDRVDGLNNGDIAILDYKTGAPDNYRGHEAVKLQPYLYTLAYEQMNPNTTVRDAGYLFLKDIADYLAVPQDHLNRLAKEKLVLSLLDRMRDEAHAMTAAPGFEISSENGIAGIGDAKTRSKCLKDCSKYCDYIDLCTADRQIAEAQQAEIETEGTKDV